MKNSLESFDGLAEPALVELLGGTFEMGDLWNEGEKDEQPALTLQLKAFALGRYAVTVVEYLGFLNACGANHGPDGDLYLDAASLPGIWEHHEYHCESDCRLLPMVSVSWHGAHAYCQWLAARHGRSYRLPTEAEWQFAASQGGRLRWSHGNEFDRGLYVTGAAQPVRVNEGTPNAAGFYHLTGNVFEWTSDEYSFALGTTETTLPKHRVIKGGAFILSEPANFRNARRFSCYEGSCLRSIGFRVCCDVK
jgi:formylglycine-generating enzyme required for sulfatase activity